jgi:branched-chain amino acid transport system permease protein
MNKKPLSRPWERTSFGRRLMIWVAAIGLLLALPHWVSAGLGVAVLNQMFIMIVFTVAYNMLLGQGGMLSFGHAVFFGLGGYVSIHFVNRIAEAGWPLPLLLIPIVGGLAGLFFAVVIGSFSTGRAGTVFAMISLGVGELIAASSLIFSSFSGGEEGVSTDRTNLIPFFGDNFASELSVYYLISAWMLVAIYLMYRFSRTPVGRMANAVRDNPERTQFVGYSTRLVRFISFAASGFFAGIAGALFAINYEIVTEETVNALTSGIVLLQAYIGGVGFFAGPIVGAVIFTLLQTLLSNYTEIWALYVGIVFVAVVMYAPAGLTGLLMMHEPIWKHGSLKGLVKPYLICLVPALVAFVGVIGILEHLQALSVSEDEFALWGIVFHAGVISTWLIFGVLLVLGFVGARKTARAVADAYDVALKRAYKNILDKS